MKINFSLDCTPEEFSKLMDLKLFKLLTTSIPQDENPEDNKSKVEPVKEELLVISKKSSKSGFEDISDI